MNNNVVILLDLDGTLTLDRNTYSLDLEAISEIRNIQKLGVRVFIVTGNSYPVSRGLATYLGLDGVVAENGCVIYFDEEESLCKEIDSNLVLEFERKFNLKGSWQNRYRRYDFGFYPPDLKDDMISWANYRGLYLKTSGYALHLSYNDKGKEVGVNRLLSLLGVDRKNVIAIGDSLTDIDMMKLAAIKVAVSNADEELKAIANVVTKGSSGEGVKEYISSLANALHGSNKRTC
ncbi:phosphoglycolate phosphatase [Sulfuracidifex metallicus]|uniref:Phosphoglycolate phosphatase n=1 Tax=Sulfuracidifex metallicus DSM 6482 = JCM 9184 TaxID=523847 RepID=A0A6A9QUI9_SULME|nr:phosphoglycolate phosphatase [Sulfuracidifex metallicus]MUN28772.1 phosphoglycolate phosphatase [Sulfuracidifex metallicus DSM 6482 = JCM 9184]WOE50711.1 phosphoglycolate phosphatase [Sulfuracidifex metallicus DSM 6482 = JCM 9184]